MTLPRRADEDDGAGLEEPPDASNGKVLLRMGSHGAFSLASITDIGDFVLHCHILDHEDQGMMQNVRIALPDGSGGVTALGHH